MMHMHDEYVYIYYISLYTVHDNKRILWQSHLFQATETHCIAMEKTIESEKCKNFLKGGHFQAPDFLLIWQRRT